VALGIIAFSALSDETSSAARRGTRCIKVFNSTHTREKSKFDYFEAARKEAYNLKALNTAFEIARVYHVSLFMFYFARPYAIVGEA